MRIQIKIVIKDGNKSSMAPQWSWQIKSQKYSA